MKELFLLIAAALLFRDKSGNSGNVNVNVTGCGGNDDRWVDHLPGADRLPGSPSGNLPGSPSGSLPGSLPGSAALSDAPVQGSGVVSGGAGASSLVQNPVRRLTDGVVTVDIPDTTNQGVPTFPAQIQDQKVDLPVSSVSIQEPPVIVPSLETKLGGNQVDQYYGDPEPELGTVNDAGVGIEAETSVGVDPNQNLGIPTRIDDSRVPGPFRVISGVTCGKDYSIHDYSNIVKDVTEREDGLMLHTTAGDIYAQCPPKHGSELVIYKTDAGITHSWDLVMFPELLAIIIVDNDTPQDSGSGVVPVAYENPEPASVPDPVPEPEPIPEPPSAPEGCNLDQIRQQIAYYGSVIRDAEAQAESAKYTIYQCQHGGGCDDAASIARLEKILSDSQSTAVSAKAELDRWLIRESECQPPPAPTPAPVISPSPQPGPQSRLPAGVKAGEWVGNWGGFSPDGDNKDYLIDLGRADHDFIFNSVYVSAQAGGWSSANAALYAAQLLVNGVPRLRGYAADANIPIKTGDTLAVAISGVSIPTWSPIAFQVSLQTSTGQLNFRV